MAKQGVSKEEVLIAINAIVAEGKKPTIARIRAIVGGSPNRLLGFLQEWRDSTPPVEQQAAELSPDLLQGIESLKSLIISDAVTVGAKIRSDVDDDLVLERRETENLSRLCSEWESKNNELDEGNLELAEENKRLSIISNKQQIDFDQLKIDHGVEIEGLKKALLQQRESAEGSRMEAAKIAVKLEAMADFEQQAIDLHGQVKDLVSSRAGLEKDLAVATSERDLSREQSQSLIADVSAHRSTASDLKNDVEEERKRGDEARLMVR